MTGRLDEAIDLRIGLPTVVFGGSEFDGGGGEVGGGAIRGEELGIGETGEVGGGLWLDSVEGA